MHRGSKYYPLYSYLRQSNRDEVTVALAEIERILKEPLPPSAHVQRAWWSNRSSGAVQAAAWMDAGYHVMDLDLSGGWVTFRKPGLVYTVERKDDTVLWTGELVRALRHHLGLSQAELAERLGVRQQTISDWETEVYTPKRSTSKYLSLVAEQVAFPYGTLDRQS